MGLLDQPLTLKLVIKILFTLSSIGSIWKCFWTAYFCTYCWKEYKKGAIYAFVLLLNIAFIYWLWS